MKVINLTEHEIKIFYDTNIVVFPNTLGLEARVGTVKEHAEDVKIDGYSESHVPVNLIKYGDVIGFPERPDPEAIYIVSYVTAMALKAKGITNNVYVPDNLVRDADGRIIGCRSLGRV